MAHTYTRLLVQLVFSTKSRACFLTPELGERLFPYLGGLLRGEGCTSMGINGPDDHVHVLVSLPPTAALSDVVGHVKARSTGWVHRTFPELRDFAWQEGFSGFTFGPSQLPALRRYVQGQREHHRRVSFRELIGLLKAHGVEFDERYLD